MTFLDFVRTHQNPLYPTHDGLEFQFQVADDDDSLDAFADPAHPPYKYRIPEAGDRQPTPNNRPIDYNPKLIVLWGTSWWNWRDGLTEGCAIDFDYGHGEKALDDAGIAQVDAWAKQVSYVQNAASKGGKGRHWLVRLGNPLPAKLRGDHSRNCKAVLAQVSRDLGVNIKDYCCSFGVMQYVWARNVRIGGAA